MVVVPVVMARNTLCNVELYVVLLSNQFQVEFFYYLRLIVSMEEMSTMYGKGPRILVLVMIISVSAPAVNTGKYAPSKGLLLKSRYVKVSEVISGMLAKSLTAQCE